MSLDTSVTQPLEPPIAVSLRLGHTDDRLANFWQQTCPDDRAIRGEAACYLCSVMPKPAGLGHS